jgi:hypothetical protein
MVFSPIDLDDVIQKRRGGSGEKIGGRFWTETVTEILVRAYE